MAVWLSVVGLSEDGLDGLPAVARGLVDGAEVLAGGRRHLAMVPEDGRERLVWPTSIAAGIESLAERRGRRVCVLASGDPFCYGIGARLAERFSMDEMTVVPAPSAFTLACARLGWSRPACETISLHGRPLERLAALLHPGARILALSWDGTTPAGAAALLRRAGYGPSRLTVLEHLGGPAERRRDGTAADWPAPGDPAGRVADLNTLAVAVMPDREARPRPRVPGLPDEAFDHDGQLTKREARAVTLAALAPMPGDHLWDVGAGSGSVAIEWLRSHPRTSAVAVEPEPDRCARIAANAAALGVPDLEIVRGAAPAALAGLERPDAVFLGGGLTAPGTIEACRQALRSGGRLVANAVTVEGETVLLAAQARLGGALTRLAVARAEPVGRFTGWRPLMPVTQWILEKGHAPE